jgi:Endoglucanase
MLRIVLVTMLTIVSLFTFSNGGNINANEERYTFTLLGDKSIKVQAGDEYIEPGYEYKSSTGVIDNSHILVEGRYDTNKLGNYTLKYFSTLNGKVYHTQRVISVIDTLAPEIIFANNVEVAQGASFDLLADVTVVDNHDKNAARQLKANPAKIDTTKLGTVEVVYSVKDSRSNTAVATRKITVVADNSEKPAKPEEELAPPVEEPAEPEEELTPPVEKPAEPEEELTPPAEKILTAQDMVNQMTVGWNLGNALDSTDYLKTGLGTKEAVTHYETLWGNPVITKKLLEMVRDKGINTVRIPVTWYDHMDENGVISPLWLDRVEEVVNYALDLGLYTMIDVHHDTGLYKSWIYSDANNIEENKANLKMVWEQIGERFKDYGQELMFEGFNEIVDPAINYDWQTGYFHTISVMELNQVFVDTVREIGGNNKDRILVVTTFSGLADDQKLETFRLPIDKTTGKEDDKVILAVHDYTRTKSGIDSLMQRINRHIVARNIPVIINEFGIMAREITSPEERATMTKYFVEEANKYGIKCFWWDNGGDYIIINRWTHEWFYEYIVDALIEGAKTN